MLFSMALSHQDLLKCCILILDGFDDDVYAIENRIQEFFNAHEVVRQFILINIADNADLQKY